MFRFYYDTAGCWFRLGLPRRHRSSHPFRASFFIAAKKIFDARWTDSSHHCHPTSQKVEPTTDTMSFSFPASFAISLVFYLCMVNNPSMGLVHHGLQVCSRHETRIAFTEKDECLNFIDYNDGIKNQRRDLFRQALVFAAGFISPLSLQVCPVLAKKPDVSKEEAFDAIRRELTDEAGSVAALQSAIDEKDFTKLLDLTKTMDQTLRKAVMGTAKKFVAESDVDKGTAFVNAVTFDLIGINKSSRPGREDAKLAAQYLQELRQDMEKMLALEPKD